MKAMGHYIDGGVLPRSLHIYLLSPLCVLEPTELDAISVLEGAL